MGVRLGPEYEACRRVVARSGSSFTAGMRLFPADKRHHIYAVYAFFRQGDDYVDEPGWASRYDRQEALVSLRAEIEAIELGLPQVQAGRADVAALRCTMHECGIPADVFDRFIVACFTDLDPVRLPDLAALERYCDGVAGTVGEACLRVLGYHDAELLKLSEANARGVQITNILRDLDEDRALDRVYLPADLLQRHSVTPDDLGRHPRSPGLRAAMAEVGGVAREWYARATPLFDALAPEHRPPIVAMTLKYRRLLDRMTAMSFEAPQRVSLGLFGNLDVLRQARRAQWQPTWLA